MQSGLPRFYGEGLLVFLCSIFPAIAFREHVAKESMPPRGVWIETSAPIGQTRRQIQVLVSNFEQGLGLVGIEVGDFAVLLQPRLESSPESSDTEPWPHAHQGLKDRVPMHAGGRERLFPASRV